MSAQEDIQQLQYSGLQNVRPEDSSQTYLIQDGVVHAHQDDWKMQLDGSVRTLQVHLEDAERNLGWLELEVSESGSITLKAQTEGAYITTEDGKKFLESAELSDIETALGSIVESLRKANIEVQNTKPDLDQVISNKLPEPSQLPKM